MHEDVDTTHEVDEPPERTAEQSRRMQQISDMEGEARDDLSVLLEEKEVSYRIANLITYSLLYELVLISDDTGLRPEDAEPLAEAASAIRSALPFSQEEVEGLASRMRQHEDVEFPEDSSPWHDNTTTEDLVLLDRWRRWLADTYEMEPPEPPGQQIADAVSQMGDVLNEIF
jgi:hypothetical protein